MSYEVVNLSICKGDGGITVLIVDDEQEILNLIAEELVELDKSIQVILANTGYSALQCIQEQTIDLLLTDIAIPDMDGFQLYQRTKEIRPDMPIIMMTGFGYDPNHALLNSKKMGLTHTIYKPFDMNKLYKMICDVLGREIEK